MRDGEFSWDFEVPEGAPASTRTRRSSFHDPSQVAGTPFLDDDRFIIKFNNFWTIEAPQGYSLLFTHPVNRTDLPFTTITGLVDSDSFSRQSNQFPGALARFEFQRCPAEGHAGRAMPAGQARAWPLVSMCCPVTTPPK